MRERVQVQGPAGAQQLQTVARPGATSSGAPRMGTSKGIQLAEALSSISPEITRQLTEAQAVYEERQAARAYDTIQGMTFEQAQAMVDGGQLRDTENPWYAAAFQKQFGLAYAGRRRRQIADAYENQFDKHNGDIEAFLAAQTQRDLSLYGDNRFVASGYREGMGEFATRLRDSHAEFRSSVVRSTSLDQFRGAAATVIDEAVAQNADPSEAARGLYEQHRQAFGLTYQQMDDNILELAAEYAEAGDAATVEALLGTDVVGADGQRVGSFLTRTRYAEQANTILNRARTKRGSLDREFMTGEVVGLRQRAGGGALTEEDRGMLEGMKRDGLISQEMHESLLVQNTNAIARANSASYDGLQESSYKDHVANELLAGRAFGVTDFTYQSPDGKTHTIGRDAVMDQVVSETLTSMARNGYSEGEMAATLASWGVGSTFQVWENALSDGYLALGQALSSAGPDGTVELPPAALAAYGTWRNLAEYPNVRARHVKDGTALKVYRDAEALERGGMDPETALLQAGRIDRNETRSGVSRSLDRSSFERSVNGLADLPGFTTGDASNMGWVSATVERTTRVLMDSGLPQSKAQEEAVRMFEESHTPVNGVYVNTRNKLIPPEFSDMSTIMIDQFAQQYGEDPNDLTLIPTLNGEQTWVIARKGTLMPHEEWVNGGAFNITDIQQRYGEYKAQETELQRQEVNRELAEDLGYQAAQDRFYELPRRHRVQLLNLDPASDAYRRMQDAFGKDIYPDGGFEYFSPNLRQGN